MRNVLLAFGLLAVTTGNAVAQTTSVGPWRPRPTFGVALGAFGAITNNSDAKLIRSVTLEVPIVDKARIRIEAGRSSLPIVPESARDSRAPTDTARIERLTISLAGLLKPGAPASAYGGIGVGLFRTRFDYAPKPPVRGDVYAYAGVEVLPSDRFTVDAELGFAGLREDYWYRRNLMTGEAVIRLKVGL